MIPRKALTVERSIGGTMSYGRYTEGTPTTLAITASVQPLRPDEMQLLPEGRRPEESFRLYTDTRLLTANRGTNKNADIVTIDGTRYEVLSCATWQNDIINHYKAIVSKI